MADVKIIFCIMLVLAVFSAGCVKNTGWAIGALNDDTVHIETEEVIDCCTYVDGEGLERTCSVLARYNCSFCEGCQ